MQNERLFKKIKHTALTETSGIKGYNPDKLWADIEKKRSKKSIWLWWPYAAASILLFIGLSFWLQKLQQPDHPVTAKRSRIESSPVELSKDKIALERSRSGSVASVASKGTNHSKESIKPNIKEPFLLAQAKDLEVSKVVFADSLSSQEDVVLLKDTTESRINRLAAVKPDIEKVLIADISFPEEKTAEYSALRQIFDQVRKERQARKMRLQLHREVNKPGLWSFVHNSFVQYPSISYPIPTKKKADLPH